MLKQNVTCEVNAEGKYKTIEGPLTLIISL